MDFELNLQKGKGKEKRQRVIYRGGMKGQFLTLFYREQFAAQNNELRMILGLYS